MLKYFAALAILTSGFCTAPPRGPKAPAVRAEDVEAERYAVYSVLLNNMYGNLKQEVGEKQSKVLVVQGQTDKDNTSEEEWRHIKAEPAWKPALDDYKAKNLQPSVIADKLNAPTKVVLVSKEEVEKFFCEGCGWWEAFYKKYPNSPGLITFSNVGFNPEMTYALVDVRYHCGGLCGEGGMVLLVKKDGTWIEEGQLTRWES